jgi:hypothetical protein
MHLYICEDMCINIFECTYICIYICLYVCVYVIHILCMYLHTSNLYWFYYRYDFHGEIQENIFQLHCMTTFEKVRFSDFSYYDHTPKTKKIKWKNSFLIFGLFKIFTTKIKTYFYFTTRHIQWNSNIIIFIIY